MTKTDGDFIVQFGIKRVIQICENSPGGFAGLVEDDKRPHDSAFFKEFSPEQTMCPGGELLGAQFLTSVSFQETVVNAEEV
ncbi:MAG TPA: hypothetical protein VFM02_04350 [Candidatus Paceibacterota bacterium]|nr:hypothetical protein [Candidatus Paceibacterota bacterium]